METFSASEFVNIAIGLERLSALSADTKLEGNWEKTVDRLDKALNSVGLELSRMVIAKMKRGLSSETKKPESMANFIAQSAELRERIADELKLEFFLHMPRSQAVLYREPDSALGKEITSKWPRMATDISEAAKCFSLSRFTASVFHLMRVMESAVQEFGTKLGIALVNEKNWQNILDEINKAVKLLDPKKDPLVKDYASISANLYAVKLAWRNEVMHPKETYTEEEAGDIFHAVRAFLRELIKVV